jgi:hypothetical protein
MAKVKDAPIQQRTARRVEVDGFLVGVESEDLELDEYLDAIGSNYPGDPVEDLARGDFVPQTPIDVAFALQSLAQGFVLDGDEPWREKDLRTRRLEVVDIEGVPRVVVGREGHPNEKFQSREDPQQSDYGLRTFNSRGSMAIHLATSDVRNDITMWSGGDPAFNITTFEDRRPVYCGTLTGPVGGGEVPIDLAGLPNIYDRLSALEEARSEVDAPSFECAGCNFSGYPWHDDLLRDLVLAALTSVRTRSTGRSEPRVVPGGGRAPSA